MCHAVIPRRMHHGPAAAHAWQELVGLAAASAGVSSRPAACLLLSPVAQSLSSAALLRFGRDHMCSPRLELTLTPKGPSPRHYRTSAVAMADGCGKILLGRILETLLQLFTLGLAAASHASLILCPDCGTTNVQQLSCCTLGSACPLSARPHTHSALSTSHLDVLPAQ